MSSSTANYQYNSPTDFRIQQLTPEDVPPEFRAAFSQIYGAIQQIIFAMVNNAGIGPRNSGQWSDLAGTAATLLSGNLNRLYIEAAENIAYGAAVNVYNSAGVIVGRNANATDSSKPCHGFCTLVGGIVAGTVGEIQIGSGVAAISSLTPGTAYFLSTTNGLLSAFPPNTVGNIAQYVGFAVTSTTLAFNIDYWKDVTINPNARTIVAGEDLLLGSAVSFTDVAGILTARNANATTGARPCQGFCTEIGGIATGNSGEVSLATGYTSVSGLTPGQSYYLSTTDGLIAASPAVAAGNIEQYVGFGVTSTLLSFNTGYWRQH